MNLCFWGIHDWSMWSEVYEGDVVIENCCIEETTKMDLQDRKCHTCNKIETRFVEITN